MPVPDRDADDIVIQDGNPDAAQEHPEVVVTESEPLPVADVSETVPGVTVNVHDAALCVTFPGTVASLRQMWGRAGRRGRGLALYVAGEDALDQFFCRHPDEFLERPVEQAILDHESEQIHEAHLAAAAYELPLTPEDGEIFGPRWEEHARRLVENGKDVVIVLDSLTRLARAHNTVERGTGRTLSGGLDATAMARPKAFFGSARSVAPARSSFARCTRLRSPPDSSPTSRC